jgi:putative redox protein
MKQRDQKNARLIWKGDGLNFSGTLGSGYQFDASSPADEESGSPMEFLLAGVAGCTAIDVLHVLKKMRQGVTGLEVEISGVRATEHPKVYTDVEILYLVQGEDVEPSAVERAIKLSMERYCSASAIFQRAGINMVTEYRIEPQEALVPPA